MSSRGRIILILTLLISFFGFMVYKNIDQSLSYYYQISELQTLETVNQQIRVKGNLIKESVDWKAEIPLLTFTLTDGENALEMEYHGVIPDNFTHSQEVIAEGQMMDEDRFHVTKLMLQCPSKYEKGEE